jgi:serine/threonine protein kinase
MSAFQWAGVPVPVSLAIIESTTEALAVLERHYVVCSDLKPENIIFVERDHRKLESAAKKALCAPLFNLFDVRIIDLGLSFLLPVSRRPDPPMSKSAKTAPEKQQDSSSAAAAAAAPTSARSISSSRSISSLSPQRRQQQQLQQQPGSPLGPQKNAQLSANLAPSAQELMLLRMSNYRRGVTVQTREYRAPEVILGAHFDRSDVWSLGCTLWELVTGTFLFDPKAEVDYGSEEAAAALSEQERERIMDLRHLFEIHRVLGDAPATYLARWGEGGSGVHATRFIDHAASAFRFQWPAAPRDLYAESRERFGMDADAEEGHRYFVAFVLACVQWVPSQRPTAEELTRHPLFTVYGRQ